MRQQVVSVPNWITDCSGCKYVENILFRLLGSVQSTVEQITLEEYSQLVYSDIFPCTIERHTHSLMELSPSWEAANCATTQELPSVLWNPKPTAAARVRARVWSYGICGGQNGAGAGFVRVLRFPLPIFIPPVAPQSPSSIVWGLYNRPEVAAVPVDLVPPH
jgi:hypothetical protein